MLRALANRVNIRIVHATHLIVNYDAALHGESTTGGDLPIGFDSGGDDHHIGF